ncbi:MAG: 3-dehydroquinate dehydratase [Deltaproteobacteria bacterium]|nr:3-dehydroquinate dehydratase [Deltaproteobacteria bacterium]
MKLLVIHGPNLDLLGHRDPAQYGSETLAALDARLVEAGQARGVEVACRQSNLEGALVEWLHEALPASHGGEGAFDAVVVNPGGYAHTSVALRDAFSVAVEAGLPVVEVHLSNVHGREDFRQRLLTGAVASGVITGMGSASYLLGIEAALRLAEHTD